MKNGNGPADGRPSMEGYVNHGLSGSTTNVDSYGTDMYQSFRDSNETHRGIQGSSDFIREYRTRVATSFSRRGDNIPKR